uniref:Symplectin/biotinidase-like protein 3 n=1 Tax=Pterygioteuthis hoylei TaxID=559549 RepID=A0A2Z5EQ36_PTEHO|nr:symplectin/biotinidase-like protein 3 [Pterygioteuthis hoylei]
MAFVPRGPISPLVLLITAMLVSYYINGSYGQRYSASLIEFTPKEPRIGAQYSRLNALELMETNIKVYSNLTGIAGRQRNEIIVFPEYGLFGIFGYGKHAKRSEIYPFLEFIPDVSKNWNPCKDKTKIVDTDIQQLLSCLANTYDIYLVANVGEKVLCNDSDRNCPKDGRFQYNTNVVYSSNGTLIAKYRKKHLYKEPHYDSPSKTEIVTFNSHFGKFGLMTSYDSLFKSPLVDLVELGIREFLMPNAWENSKPLFSSVQWGSSLARGLDINLLLATVHDVHRKSYGTGIFTENRVREYVSNQDNVGIQMIRGEIRALSPHFPTKARPVIPKWRKENETKNSTMDILGATIKIKYVGLHRTKDTANVCHNGFCCRLDYEVYDELRIEKYGLAVYKGHVAILGHYLEIEMCAFLRCSESCGAPIKRSNTFFERFKLEGVNFTTQYIYPQVTSRQKNLDTGEFEHYQDSNSWTYTHGKIVYGPSDARLDSASLIGRVYDKDVVDHRSKSNGNGGSSRYMNFASEKYVSSVILILAVIASMKLSS